MSGETVPRIARTSAFSRAMRSCTAAGGLAISVGTIRRCSGKLTILDQDRSLHGQGIKTQLEDTQSLGAGFGLQDIRPEQEFHARLPGPRYLKRLPGPLHAEPVQRRVGLDPDHERQADADDLGAFQTKLRGMQGCTLKDRKGHERKHEKKNASQHHGSTSR